jgi:anthranilate synthase/aminodeoxychorismate synthase-like glutamine amidotransferase
LLLLIDNYDSFVYNLARYFVKLGCATQVVRNDAIDVAGIRKLAPQAIVLSPGPCTPSEAGCTLDVVRALGEELPMLGVCLGHQAIAAAYGARIVRAPIPMHGRVCRIRHDSKGIFDGAPDPLAVGRYHSLVVERASLPAELVVQAETEGEIEPGVVMAFQHARLPLVGVQFHPESILTDAGYLLLYNFLRLAGIAGANTRDVNHLDAQTSELKLAASAVWSPPLGPVTF